MNVIVSALISSHDLGPCVENSSCRQGKWHATASLILCCLR